jgi:hypothetical protein
MSKTLSSLVADASNREMSHVLTCAGGDVPMIDFFREIAETPRSEENELNDIGGNTPPMVSFMETNFLRSVKVLAQDVPRAVSALTPGGKGDA